MNAKEPNLFYDNHIFKEEDLNRMWLTWKDKIWLWLYPTYVQITEAGVFHYKNVGGKYYLMKVTKL